MLIHGRRLVVLLTSVLTVSSCATSQPLDLTTRPRIDTRDFLIFSYHGRTVELHGAVVGHDSLTGIPWEQRAACCGHVTYASAEISHPKIVHPPEGTPVGAVILGALGLFVLSLVLLAYSLPYS